MVISTMPRKYAVPAGRPRIRVFPTRAARYIGCAVSDREGLDGLDTHPTSQISGRLGYAIGKTRSMEKEEGFVQRESKRPVCCHRPPFLGLQKSEGGVLIHGSVFVLKILERVQ